MCRTTEENLFQLRDEDIDHVLDLWRFGREQDQLLVQQMKLQHVRRRGGDKQDLSVAANQIKNNKKMKRNKALSEDEEACQCISNLLNLL